MKQDLLKLLLVCRMCDHSMPSNGPCGVDCLGSSTGPALCPGHTVSRGCSGKELLCPSSGGLHQPSSGCSPLPVDLDHRGSTQLLPVLTPEVSWLQAVVPAGMALNHVVPPFQKCWAGQQSPVCEALWLCARAPVCLGFGLISQLAGQPFSKIG